MEVVAAFLQTPVPGDLSALLWAIVLALAGVVGTLFWQLIRTRDKNVERIIRMNDRYYEIVGANTEALNALSEMIADQKRSERLERRIGELERQLNDRRKAG